MKKVIILFFVVVSAMTVSAQVHTFEAGIESGGGLWTFGSTSEQGFSYIGESYFRYNFNKYFAIATGFNFGNNYYKFEYPFSNGVNRCTVNNAISAIPIELRYTFMNKTKFRMYLNEVSNIIVNSNSTYSELKDYYSSDITDVISVRDNNSTMKTFYLAQSLGLGASYQLSDNFKLNIGTNCAVVFNSGSNSFLRGHLLLGLYYTFGKYK